MSLAAVLMDIEGTTSALATVRDVLFPYARERFEGWLARQEPEIDAIVNGIAADCDCPRTDTATIAAALKRWSDDDVKAPSLKALQGMIWQAGFAAGELQAHVYDDVPLALTSWQRQGLKLCVYSSGSVLAQRSWFAHTNHGDLGPSFSRYFDAQNPGPKTASSSYAAIASAIGTAPELIVYLSDSRAELDAARAAGCHTIGVSRNEDGRPDVGEHPTVGSFAEIALSAGHPAGVTGGRHG